MGRHSHDNNRKSSNKKGCGDAHAKKHDQVVEGTSKKKAPQVQCTECGKWLSQKSDLGRHWGTHSRAGRNGYICPWNHVCQAPEEDVKVILQLHNLMTHMHRHVVRQPWTCGFLIACEVWCTKRFSNRDDRCQHRIQVHGWNDENEDKDEDEAMDDPVEHVDGVPRPITRRVLRGPSDVQRVASCLYDLHVSGVPDINFKLPVRGATLHLSPQTGLPYYQIHIEEDNEMAGKKKWSGERASDVEEAYEALKRGKNQARSRFRRTIRNGSRRRLISDNDDSYNISGHALPQPPRASSSRIATIPWFDDAPHLSHSVPSPIGPSPSPEPPRASSSRLPAVPHSYQLARDRSDPLHAYSYMPPEPPRGSSNSPDTSPKFTYPPPPKPPCASSSRLPAPRFDDAPHPSYQQVDFYSYPPPRLHPASPYRHAPYPPSLNITHSDHYRHYHQRVVEDACSIQRRHLPTSNHSDPLRYYSENVRINSHPYLARRPRPGLTGAFASAPSGIPLELPTPPWSPPPACQGGHRSCTPSPSPSLSPSSPPPPPPPVQCPMKWTDMTGPSLPPNFRGFRK
ncbi:unnamed protein product [Somion occarium]|uniref:C2H2-type domain-containing protein n=1 Tax=Somion occarium TaxID=3059160 RepID=A0ABP1DW22_9APHY